ncbi:MAG: 2-C-methyl-D-erythritol 4-phosphate cytidylyltransferase [Deltaproteobacteria bacterium]|jgi:2-C-methyl-D-erythritol 4-phosphate cytidylyltransferase/2-C-methyl-D-erythritol 2,4-cyclodiphosphate synthase|nr:2-C-methyl-D-erythritol 4-phosphate cytidylyltransferase [Deltaproteobacteria bacterium]
MKHPWGILLAAGQGKRLELPPEHPGKQFISFNGLPLFWRSALTLAAVPRVKGIILVFPQRHMAYAAAIIRETTGQTPLGRPYVLVPGGSERQDSVWNGLNSLPPECDSVLVHDSARPLAGAALINRVLDGLAAGYKAVIPGLEPSDTIKQVDERGLVLSTLPRSNLRYAQTPQGFDRHALLAAHIQGKSEGLLVTDDAAMMEHSGFKTLVVPGERGNHKITVPEDLELLRLKESRPPARPCTGFGYDVHRYGGSRPCKLGGVLIDSAPQIFIAAHSDGDTLLHALMDALLGCAGAGDIGLHFPDTDERYNNMDSAILLSEVLELIRALRIELCHVDMTIVAQVPKIAPFRTAITKNVAHLLHLDENLVNLKATTEEGLGFTGAKQGIKAMVVVSGLNHS